MLYTNQHTKKAIDIFMNPQKHDLAKNHFCIIKEAAHTHTEQVNVWCRWKHPLHMHSSSISYERINSADFPHFEHLKKYLGKHEIKVKVSFFQKIISKTSISTRKKDTLQIKNNPPVTSTQGTGVSQHYALKS